MQLMFDICPRELTIDSIISALWNRVKAVNKQLILSSLWFDSSAANKNINIQRRRWDLSVANDKTPARRALASNDAWLLLNHHRHRSQRQQRFQNKKKEEERKKRIEFLQLPHLLKLKKTSERATTSFILLLFDEAFRQPNNKMWTL